MAGKAQQATPGRRSGSRAQARAETRREQWVLIGVGVVLLVAAAIVAAGLFITQYLPPRAHVLTVDGTDYDAGDVVRRAAYLVRFEPGGALIQPEGLVDETLKRIERDHILRKRAPAIVGAVTEDDIEHELRALLGFATPTPVPAASATPAPTSTATATATAAPTPTVVPPQTPTARPFDVGGYATALRDVLRDVGMGRKEHDRLVEARLLNRRLRDRYEAELGKTAPQLRLARIRLTDQAAAERVREQAASGTDFAKLAADNSLEGTTRAAGGELGWRVVELLEPEVRDALKGLTKGSIAVVRSGSFLDVYKVVEENERRDIEAGQLVQLVDRKMDAWFDVEGMHVAMKRDVSDGEAAWIRERAVKRIQDARS